MAEKNKAHERRETAKFEKKERPLEKKFGEAKAHKMMRGKKGK